MVIAIAFVALAGGAVVGLLVGLGFRRPDAEATDDPRRNGIVRRTLPGFYAHWRRQRSPLHALQTPTEDPLDDSMFPPTQMMTMSTARAQGLATSRHQLAPASPHVPARQQAAPYPPSKSAMLLADAFKAVSQPQTVSGTWRVKYLLDDDTIEFCNLSLLAFGSAGTRGLLLADCNERGRRTFDLARIQACLDLQAKQIVSNVPAWLAQRATSAYAHPQRRPARSIQAHATLQ